MLKVQQAAVESTLSQEVTLIGLDGIDVPGVRRRVAAHGILVSSGPIRTVHAVLIDDENLEDLIRIVLVGHLARQDGDVIGILGQGEPGCCLHEHVSRGQSGAGGHAEQPNRAIRSDPIGRGCIAGGHGIRTSSDHMEGQCLLHGAGIHQGKRSTGIGRQLVQTLDGIRFKGIGVHQASGITIRPASRC